MYIININSYYLVNLLRGGSFIWGTHTHTHTHKGEFYLYSKLCVTYKGSLGKSLNVFDLRNSCDIIQTIPHFNDQSIFVAILNWSASVVCIH